MIQASMPMKCMDQMPPPMATAAAVSQALAAPPDVFSARPARSREVKEAKTATA
jgi:hypothetical protein